MAGQPSESVACAAAAVAAAAWVAAAVVSAGAEPEPHPANTQISMARTNSKEMCFFIVPLFLRLFKIFGYSFTPPAMTFLV